MTREMSKWPSGDGIRSFVCNILVLPILTGLVSALILMCFLRFG